MKKKKIRFLSLFLAMLLLLTCSIPAVTAAMEIGDVVHIYHPKVSLGDGYTFNYLATKKLSGDNIHLESGGEWLYCLDKNHLAADGSYKGTDPESTAYWTHLPREVRDGIKYILYAAPKVSSYDGTYNIYVYRAAQLIIWEYLDNKSPRTSASVNQTINTPNYYVNRAYTAILQLADLLSRKIVLNNPSVNLTRTGEEYAVYLTDSSGGLASKNWTIDGGGSSKNGIHVERVGNQFKVWADSSASNGTTKITLNSDILTSDQGAVCFMVGAQQAIMGQFKDPDSVDISVTLEKETNSSRIVKFTSNPALETTPGVIENAKFKFYNWTTRKTYYGMADAKGNIYEATSAWTRTENRLALEPGEYDLKEVRPEYEVNDNGIMIAPTKWTICTSLDGIIDRDYTFSSSDITYNNSEVDPGYSLSHVDLTARGVASDYWIEMTIDNEYVIEDLEIIKTSDDNHVEGIKFKVETYVTFTGDWTGGTEYITDEDGKISIPAYVGQRYRVTEIVPDDYRADVVSKEITIRKGTNTLYFHNTPISNGLTVVKKSDDGKVDGITFTVTDKSGRTVASGETDLEGNLYFPHLTIGETYTVTETVPEGYFCKSENPQRIRIKGFPDTNVLTFENITTRDATIIKTSDDGKVSGITFTVTDKSGSTVGSGRTDTQGKLTISNLKIGETYTFTETVPTGYTGEDGRTVGKQSKTLKIQEGSNEIRFANKLIKGSLEILKVDEDGKTPLTGAGFRVYDSGGKKVAEGHTGKDGKLTFDNLPYGLYTYQEYEVPEGFEPDNTKYPFSITEPNQRVAITRKNDVIEGSIRIHKTDQDGNQLTGVSFLLEYSTDDGKTYRPVTLRRSTDPALAGTCTSSGLKDGILVTDKSGDAVFTGLRINTQTGNILYRLTETATLDGYQLLSGPAFTGELRAAEETDVELTVTNTHVYTLPSTGGRGYAGVVFAVFLAGIAAAVLLFIRKKRPAE